MNKKQKSFSGINIGSASMLLIFIILCLVSFAALSIVSANADRKLSEKIATRTQSYYEACNKAEEALAQLDDTLQAQYKASSDEKSYYEAVGHQVVYSIPVSDTQALHVEAEILYPIADTDTYYQVTAWYILNDANESNS